MNEVQGFLLEDSGVRGALVRLTETWQQVTAQHCYPPELERLLGEGVAATVLLANGLKDQPKVSMQLQGDGALKLLLIQCSADMAVRGLAQWRDYSPGDSLLGQGRLAVNLDTGSDLGIFQGIVPLVGDRLETCIEAYFSQSEQLATTIVLTSAGDSVAGLLLQAMPGGAADVDDEPAGESFAQVAKRARAVSRETLLGCAAAEFLPRLFERSLIRLLEPRPVLHDCRCTPEHLANVARMLGEEELNSLLEEEGRVELTCEFCNRAFRYDEAGVRAILEGGAPGAKLH